MEIINENYIFISFEFNEESKVKQDDFRIALLGREEELIKLKKNKKNIKFHNVPVEIRSEFIKKIKETHNVDLDENIKYLYPIDFSLIKRIIHTYDIERYKNGKPIIDEKTGKVKKITRYINKAPGVIILYKYMGSITFIKDFVNILNERFKIWQNYKNDNDKDIFFKIKKFQFILGAESEYLNNAINQNYFTIYFEFKPDKKADPNNFRRCLLGLKKRIMGKEEEIHPNVPREIRSEFIKKIKETHNIDLDENIKYLYPIDFSIIKRPIILYYTEENKPKISNLAVGVIVLYKYMGPITFINDFKKIFQDVFKNLIKQWPFKKANAPLIIIGAELEAYNILD